jgi:predicted DNA-binding protein
MSTKKYTRISISIPIEIYDRVKNFNNMNKKRPFNISVICREAIEKELDDEEFIDEIIDIGYQFYEEDKE